MSRTRVCQECKRELLLTKFISSRSSFFLEGRTPICEDCFSKRMERAAATNTTWQTFSKICQYLDIPFSPEEFELNYKRLKSKITPVYAQIFLGQETETVDWSELNNEYLKLRDSGESKYIIPGLQLEELKTLRVKWGQENSEPDLIYLESLYQSMLVSFPVTNATQLDQLTKVCKISLLMDKAIETGESKGIKEYLDAYDKICKTAGFISENAQNVNDLESVGELFSYLEKRGWMNQYYDGVSRDIVDKTMASIQKYNRKLYVEEGSLEDEITRKIELLKSVESIGLNYDAEEDSSIEGELEDEFSAEFEIDLD